MSDDTPAASPISTLLSAALPGLLSRAKVVVSPYPFALSDDDSLRVTAVNALAGVSIEIHVRRVTKDGSIVPDRFVLAPTSDRIATAKDFQLSGGFVSNMTVFATGGSPKIGQTFVIVQMIRGMGASAFVLGTLLAGPVTAVQGIGWPGSAIQSSVESGGYLRQIVGTQPAAGAVPLETVPTGARWELVAFAVQLTTDGTVANRQPDIELHSAASTYLRVQSPYIQTAGTSRPFHWAQGLPTVVATGNMGLAGLPTNVAMLAGDVITLGIAGTLAAGDQFSAPTMIVKELLEAS